MILLSKVRTHTGNLSTSVDMSSIVQNHLGGKEPLEVLGGIDRDISVLLFAVLSFCRSYYEEA